MFAIEFYSVTRHFGSVKAVDGVDLAIAHGEFCRLFGLEWPSAELTPQIECRPSGP